MTRYPIEQYTNAREVTGIDKRAEIIRRPVAAGRRKQRDRLITPRAIKRIFSDRQQFNMGKAHIDDVGQKLGSEVAIDQIPIAFKGPAPPGAKMDLVYCDRRLAVVGAPALGHPCAIPPDVG